MNSHQISFNLLQKQLYNIKDSKPSSLPWLPEFEERNLNNTKYIKGIFASIHNNPCHEGIWNMIENSMPLYLHNKYHSYQIWNLVEPNVDLNYIPLLCYYTMQNEILGLPLWSLISTKYDTFTQIKSKSDLDKWKEQVNSIIHYLKMTLSGRYAIQEPSEKDFCKKSSEFVLCSSIQIQLPWKPIIFHQWLIAAFSDLLLFEIETLELRHWPIPKNMVSLATNIITLIKELKQKILFGFVIFNAQIKSYNKRDSKYPDIIMDDVVLPSLPILQFLYSGLAHKIIKLIKVHAWSKYEKLDLHNNTLIDSDSYLLDTYLAEFSKDFCYNYIIWNREKLQEPFPFNPDNFEQFLYRLKTKSFKTDNDFEDNLFFIEMENNESAITSTLDDKQKIELTIKTIKEEIIDTNKLPGLTENDIEKCINTPEMLALVHNEMFSENIKNHELQIVRYAMNYNEASRLLTGCKKEKSAIAQIITLQLKIIEREVLLKIISILSMKFQIRPIYKRIECFDTINTNSLQCLIQDVYEDIASQNRFKLWWKFPNGNKNTVSLNENCPSTCKDLNYIVKLFQDRLCRLVYHTAVQSFKINSSGGEPFSEWTTIQYILPCIISSYVLEYTIFTENKIKFVHSVIKYYEIKYNEWVTNCNPKKIPQHPKTYDEIVNMLAEGHLEKYEWLCLNLKLRENLRVILGYHYHNKFYDARIIGIDHVLNYLGDWPTNMTYITNNTNLQYPILKILLKWWKFSVLFQETLLKIAVETFNVPKPGNDIIQYPRFSDLYLTSSILSELQIVYDLASQNSTINTRLKSEIDDVVNGKQQYHYDIFKTLMTLDKYTEKDNANFISIKKKTEVNIYQKLKKYRKQSGTLQIKLVHVLPLSKLYPQVRQAVMHYINGNFDELEQMLSLFCDVKVDTNTSKKCKHCGKIESGRKFLTCEKCIADKYPDVNYYCGRRCQDTRWNSEHMAEHLEFDLGLLDVTK